jgi:hypothetical protein
VRYRDLVEPAVSPIIMSCRANERTDALRHMADVIARRYENWSYPVPEAVLRLAYGQD